MTKADTKGGVCKRVREGGREGDMGGKKGQKNVRREAAREDGRRDVNAIAYKISL